MTTPAPDPSEPAIPYEPAPRTRVRDFQREQRVVESAKAGLTPRDIADTCGYPLNYVYRVIRRRGLPTNRTIHPSQPLGQQILRALALGTSPDRLKSDHRLSDPTWLEFMRKCSAKD